jgi:hypothetical protein
MRAPLHRRTEEIGACFADHAIADADEAIRLEHALAEIRDAAEDVDESRFRL